MRDIRANVVVKWLDPLTFDNGKAAPRFGSNNDFIAFFDESWTSFEQNGAPYFYSTGAGMSGWMWVNHEYVSNTQPTATAAPTGQHLTLARFLRYRGLLRRCREADFLGRQGFEIDAGRRERLRHAIYRRLLLCKFLVRGVRGLLGIA